MSRFFNSENIRIKCVSSILRKRTVKTQQSLVVLNLVIVFKKLRFQNVFCHVTWKRKVDVFKFFPGWGSVFEKSFFFVADSVMWTVRLTRRNRAAFSDCSARCPSVDREGTSVGLCLISKKYSILYLWYLALRLFGVFLMSELRISLPYKRTVSYHHLLGRFLNDVRFKWVNSVTKKASDDELSFSFILHGSVVGCFVDFQEIPCSSHQQKANGLGL